MTGGRDVVDGVTSRSAPVRSSGIAGRRRQRPGGAGGGDRRAAACRRRYRHARRRGRHRILPRELHDRGSAFVPADRQRFGLVLYFPLTDNLVLNDYYRPPFARGLVRDEAAIPGTPSRPSSSTTSERLPPPRRPGRCRAATSRSWWWRARSKRELRLLVLDQPTRGLDVGSIEFIHRQAIAKPRRRDRDAARLRRAGRGARDLGPDRRSCTEGGSCRSSTAGPPTARRSAC